MSSNDKLGFDVASSARLAVADATAVLAPSDAVGSTRLDSWKGGGVAIGQVRKTPGACSMLIGAGPDSLVLRGGDNRVPTA